MCSAQAIDTVPRERKSRLGKIEQMHRYMVERDFPGGLEIPTNPVGLNACLGVVDNNVTEQVTWVQSFVTDDHRRTFCIYDGLGPRGDPACRRARRSPGEQALGVTWSTRASTCGRERDPFCFLYLGPVDRLSNTRRKELAHHGDQSNHHP